MILFIVLVIVLSLSFNNECLCDTKVNTNLFNNENIYNKLNTDFVTQPQHQQQLNGIVSEVEDNLINLYQIQNRQKFDNFKNVNQHLSLEDAAKLTRVLVNNESYGVLSSIIKNQNAHNLSLVGAPISSYELYSEDCQTGNGDLLLFKSEYDMNNLNLENETNLELSSFLIQGLLPTPSSSFWNEIKNVFGLTNLNSKLIRRIEVALLGHLHKIDIHSDRFMSARKCLLNVHPEIVEMEKLTHMKFGIWSFQVDGGIHLNYFLKNFLGWVPVDEYHTIINNSQIKNIYNTNQYNTIVPSTIEKFETKINNGINDHTFHYENKTLGDQLQYLLPEQQIELLQQQLLQQQLLQQQLRFPERVDGEHLQFPLNKEFNILDTMTNEKQFTYPRNLNNYNVYSDFNNGIYRQQRELIPVTTTERIEGKFLPIFEQNNNQILNRNNDLFKNIAENKAWNVMNEQQQLHQLTENEIKIIYDSCFHGMTQYEINNLTLSQIERILRNEISISKINLNIFPFEIIEQQIRRKIENEKLSGKNIIPFEQRLFNLQNKNKYYNQEQQITPTSWNIIYNRINEDNQQLNHKFTESSQSKLPKVIVPSTIPQTEFSL